MPNLGVFQPIKRLPLYKGVRNVYYQLKAGQYKFSDLLWRGGTSKGINLGDQAKYFYGPHRSGWSYAVSTLKSLSKPEGIYLDTFIERTFFWSPTGVKAHKYPWIGIIHVPPKVPDWFESGQSNQAIFETSAWKESLPYCRGLFTLSQYHKRNLENRFDFPVESLVHPTEIPEKIWSWESFIGNGEKKIVQLGWWLRKLHAIYQFPDSEYQKVLLKINEKEKFKKLFRKEKQILEELGALNDSMFDTVKVIHYLPNDEYDDLLSKNIIFLNLYDSSANNSIIECIARGTPLLVNPIEPVKEYLGEDYPFYYSSYAEALAKVSDFQLIRKTHEYLINCPVRSKLSGNYFRRSLIKSNILRNL